MSTFPLTAALRAEYRVLFNNCAVDPGRAATLEQLANSLIAHQSRYAAVGGALGIPWTVIAVIHNMEASQNFASHLHNGDPLTARTWHVPAGRPPNGTPPFTWEESATDALTFDRFVRWTDWTLPGTLYKLELYNGAGYRLYHPHVKSPYLWGFSNHYRSGKYASDGRWSDTLVSAQCGAAVLLRRLAEHGFVDFADEALIDGAPQVIPYAASRPSDPAILQQAIALQMWLTTHSGIFVKPDGWAGKTTSDAYRKVTGHYLPGDPRA